MSKILESVKTEEIYKGYDSFECTGFVLVFDNPVLAKEFGLKIKQVEEITAEATEVFVKKEPEVLSVDNSSRSTGEKKKIGFKATGGNTITPGASYEPVLHQNSQTTIAERNDRLKQTKNWLQSSFTKKGSSKELLNRPIVEQPKVSADASDSEQQEQNNRTKDDEPVFEIERVLSKRFSKWGFADFLDNDDAGFIFGAMSDV